MGFGSAAPPVDFRSQWNKKDQMNPLAPLGLTLPSPAYLTGAILFGIIGFAAYRYGKKASLAIPKWIGITLMFYPYAISETWMLYLIGAGLCIALYFFRE
jgi:hypothetical protein